MEVTEALVGAKADLASTLDELQMAKELVTALESDAKKIRLEIAGLESFANRLGLTAEPTHDGGDVVPISADVQLDESTTVDLNLLSRTDAVATVMRDASAPLDRAAIHERFIDGGRFDTIDDISLTLSGLKRSGRAEKLGQGLWSLSEEAPLQSQSF